MATHSSVLAWRIPGTVEPGLWGRKELDTTEGLNNNNNNKIHSCYVYGSTRFDTEKACLQVRTLEWVAISFSNA